MTLYCNGMKRFKKFYIEITNVCNLQCSFCPKTERKPEFMKPEIFEKILFQIKDYTDYIYLHVKGEPLLHPEIDELLDISHKNGLKVNITTNGTLIQKVKDKIINNTALRQMNFSLHSFDGNEQKFQPMKDKYMEDILSFIREANEKTDLIISLRLWNLDKNNVTNQELQRNQEMLEMIRKEFQLSFTIQEEVTPGRGIKIADRIYINQDHEFQWPDLRVEKVVANGFCYGLRNQIAILVDGTVVPCCLDGEGIIRLGNIHDSDFTSIIESERARNLIEGFSRREAVEELCRKCGYRSRFDV